MMKNCKEDMKIIQGLAYEAYITSGQIMALLDQQEVEPAKLAIVLDRMTAQFESSMVALRNLCERNRPPSPVGFGKPEAPALHLAGRVEVNAYGWLHIELNALLPHCRYQTPAYLTDTIIRLLDEYERGGHRLPRFDKAMLVIDEHCDIDSRTVYDQDNKGYKAIPNAIKGRVIKDDDQFTLNICLLSTRSDKPACHIYLLPQYDAGDFFYLIRGDFLIEP